MKKIVLLLNAIFLLTMANAQTLKTPQPSPTQTVKQNFGLGTIELDYSRPGKKDRKIMGGLVPFGKVWRTGANNATTISFSNDVSIGGKDVKSGKYGLLTIPDAGQWTIIISKDLDVTQPADYKAENDVVRVKADVVDLPFTIESFTISIGDLTGNSCNVGLMWENTYVAFPISTNTEDQVMKQIDNIMNKDTKPYYNAAAYYYDNGKDMKQALTWVNKAIDGNKEAFWMHMLKARIHNKLGEKTASKAAATSCLEYATKAKNDDYVKMANDLIAGL